ncbi:ER membrane protein complex subunit 1 [Candida viswanathii]|uniref:ER membrane protein complex subunit 1 n=1 Tax=Candida viswanathii TaxID=5486 RepID=A0A367YI01_9ASCO|nr:ER membrane protein complex subunit 1 [Candida viswanathii]
MKIDIYLLVSYFLCLTSAVLVDEAFGSREAVNYLYGGDLKNFHLLKDNILVVTNSNDQLLGIDVVNDDAIAWKIQLSGLKNSKLVATESRLFVYGSSSEAVQVDSHGNLEIIELGSVPKKIYGTKNGALIIDSESNLKYFDNDNVVPVQSDVSFVRVDQVLGHTYAIINDKKMIKLSKTGQVLFSIDLAVGSIKEFRAGIILTENDQIFKFNEHDRAFKRIENDSFKNLVIIDGNSLYSTLSEALQLIRIKDKVATLVDVIKVKPNSKAELFSTPLHEFIGITNGNIKDFYDLTDFIETKDAKSIKHFVFKSAEDFPYNFVTVEGSQLSLLSINTKLFGELFSLSDGLKVKNIAPKYHQYSSKKDKYLIIDEPESELAKNEYELILHESESNFILTNWVHRVVRHLSELGKFVTSLDYKNLFGQSDESIKFVKLVVFYDEDHHKLVSVQSNDFDIAWELPIAKGGEFITLEQTGDEEVTALFKSLVVKVDSRNGTVIDQKPNDGGYTNIFKVQDALALENKHGITLVGNLSQSAFFRRAVNNDELVGYVISPGSTKSVQTWSFKFDGPILSWANIPADSTTSSLGLPLADKSVLYKYLNPNTISALTLKDGVLKFYLIDGVTGNLLYTQAHNSAETIDPKSVSLVMDDNWIIYSYFTTQPRLEQRINVIDLFDAEYSSTAHKSSINIARISTKSFVYPERILKLQSTKSVYGITLKSIIALTELGNLIEIPKFILNSRRPENDANRANYANDFNMVPYDPIIAKTNFQVLNHKYQLKNNGEILIKPTAFESTSVICFFNSENQYCGLIQPSNSFDLLSQGFDKVKLLITIAILLVGFIVSKPFVFNKKLNAQWLDRK